MLVSVYKDIYYQEEEKSPKLVKVEKVLDEIKSDKSLMDTITLLRDFKSKGDKESYIKTKRSLPIVLWQGEFTNRFISGLSKLSGLVCLDFDHISVNLKSSLAQKFPWIYSIFISPSGDGLKVICYCPGINEDTYKSIIAELGYIIGQEFGITMDPASKTLNQTCFKSYDPDIYINPNPVGYQWQGLISEVEKKDVTNIRNLSLPPEPLEGEDYTESQKNIIKVLDEYWCLYDKRFEKGQRARSVFKMGLVLWRSKIPFSLTFEYLKHRFSSPDFTENDIKVGLTNAYSEGINTVGRTLGSLGKFLDGTILDYHRGYWRFDDRYFEPENLINSLYQHAWVLYRDGIEKGRAIDFLIKEVYDAEMGSDHFIEPDLIRGELDYIYTTSPVEEYGSFRNSPLYVKRHLGRIKWLKKNNAPARLFSDE